MKNAKTIEIIEDVLNRRYKEMWSTFNTVAYIKKEYGLSQARAYDLVKEARVEFGKYYRNTQESVLEDSLERMEQMLETAIASNNNKLAIQIQVEINKVLKLHQDTLTLDLGNTPIEINIIKPE